MESLIIRADASIEIGTGHLMRCLALAQAWKDAGGRAVFVTACQNEGLLQRLEEEEVDIRLLASPHPDPGDWDYTKDILATHPNSWAVLDGYHFDEVYQQRVKETGHPLLVIDDMAHLKHYYADIVLNQNLHAEQLHYSCEPYTRLLLSTRYVLLRREFLAWKDWKREIPEVAQRVLVTLGGSDAENHTLKVIQALQNVDVPDLEAIVVIGASNPHADVLEAAIRRGRLPIRLINSPRNMPKLMAWCDAAVSGAGITIWELLFMGTPSLALKLAKNQNAVATQIETRKVGITLGSKHITSMQLLVNAISSLLRDHDLRARACENARQLVDGQGTQRVTAAISRTKISRIRLRSASLEDCRLAWEWSNDLATREASFSSEPIPWEDHVAWFKTKLCNTGCHYYILLDERDIPIGQIRFDTTGNEAEINISIDPGFRGQGHGREAIRLASEKLFRETAITRIHARIKQTNSASFRAFTRARYRENGVEEIRGEKALKMTLDRGE